MKFTLQGHTVYAYSGGRPFDPALPCVVFIHGALHDHSVWNLLARWAAHHGYAVLALDQPGHGGSEGPLQPSVEALADWALSVLDQVLVQRAHWVGHSMGSLIALEAAARAPQRAISLSLLGTAFPMKVSPALLDAAQSAPEQGMAQVNAFSISGLASKPSYPSPGAWLHGSNLALMRQVQARHPSENVFAHDFDCCNRYERGLEAAAAVRCPTLVVAGLQDVMTPLKAARPLAEAARAQVQTLPTGHALMHEDPDGTLAALRRHWAAAQQKVDSAQ